MSDYLVVGGDGYSAVVGYLFEFAAKSLTSPPLSALSYV